MNGFVGSRRQVALEGLGNKKTSVMKLFFEDRNKNILNKKYELHSSLSI